MKRLLALLAPTLLLLPALLLLERAPRPVVIRSAPPGPVSRPIPTPPAEKTLTGIATWYDAERGGRSSWYTRAGLEFYGAAGPALRAQIPHRYGQRYRLLVTAVKTGRTVMVWVVDSCGCHGGGKERLIDLAPSVWAALDMPLSRGIMQVIIEPLD